MLSDKSKATIIERSEPIASTMIRGAEFTSDLYYHRTTLYKHRDGKFFTYDHRGAALASADIEWLSRDEAIAWLASEASDPVTGYGYTTEQALELIEGRDPGPGYRGED